MEKNSPVSAHSGIGAFFSKRQMDKVSDPSRSILFNFLIPFLMARTFPDE